MTMNADKRDSHRVSFRFWAQAQPKNAAEILHNRRACSALQGIGGGITNKQSAKSPTIALLATISEKKVSKPRTKKISVAPAVDCAVRRRGMSAEPSCPTQCRGMGANLLLRRTA